jgi:pimeloyl-ACP methyl ester carboxylesterase
LRTIIDGLEIHYEIHGQGPPLLLIHGLGSSTRDWEFQRDHFAADTASLLRQLGTAPAHVVGLSMGGMIAFQFALDAPDLVRTLTIVNSAPEVVVRSWQQRLQLLQRRLILRFLGMRAMGRLLARRLLPAPEHAALRQTFGDRWAENDARAYRDAFSALIGWGVSDKRAWVARMPNASLVVLPDSRHAVPVERPQLFNAALDRFLAAKNAPLQ